jgi:hypothetical protein
MSKGAVVSESDSTGVLTYLSEALLLGSPDLYGQKQVKPLNRDLFGADRQCARDRAAFDRPQLIRQ